MCFRHSIATRRTIGSLVCASLVLSLGCAGSPLRLRRKGLNLAETAPPANEQVVQTNVEEPAAGTTPAVVTLDSLSNAGTQPAAAQQPTAEPKPQAAARRNFANIFDNGPKENSMSDPFLNAPRAAEKPVQTAQAPAAATPQAQGTMPGRTKLENGFDSAMADLAKGTSQPKTEKKPSRNSDFNPFASMVDDSAGDDLAAKTEDKSAALAAELAAAVKAKETANARVQEISDNPFAAVMGASAAQPSKPIAKAEPKPAPQATTSAAAATPDWLRSATAKLPAKLPAPSGPIGSAPIRRQAPKMSPFDDESVPQVEKNASLDAAARERVHQLLDSAELAMRAGRYDDAETIAKQANEIVSNENLSYTTRDRSPKSILRRIASAQRLSGDTPEPAEEQASNDDPETTIAQTAEPKVEITPAQTTTSVQSFEGFPTVTTWQAVSDEADSDGAGRYEQPVTTASRSQDLDSALWQTTDTNAAIPGPPAEESPFQTASSTTAFSTQTPFGSSNAPAYQPTSFESTASVATQQETPALAPPAWPSESSAEAPKLPGLPQLGGSTLDATTNHQETSWNAPAWSQEAETQVAMANIEIAPAPPVVADIASPAPATPSVQYGNILALMTVIGLGLVAVIAFRTRPEEI